jgi:hypothetical protein
LNEKYFFLLLGSPEMKEKTFNFNDYFKIFSKYDINLLNQDLKESKKNFEKVFNNLADKDKENYSLFSHIYNLQVNIDELKRSIDNYKININEISVQKKDEMVKRQNNFDAGEVIVFLINFFLK